MNSIPKSLNDYEFLAELFSFSCFEVCVKRTYRAGKTSASNSVHKCRRMIFFDDGMPIAVAIVSPEKDGSNTTSPP